ncbi:hypothetical protein Dtox_2612 [Desulfofarcimen acetoxidans DSM 771]|uniref:Uncharacterized protein n=1 Tax=Desulfofarcimen acetoxidans (strain ATCC 49208 / DSM 771 / KCTC 5769 / VKM B-1644 / 5575) TaxID=485916 RepID=C8W109_DESAS|nr:hypothetical protein [Desulfofarcimen acetoxidans]ACV63405.1 hypothetical protein Dtox_2612 [Desulfofarcimen acetoxidans DSM 771]
MIEEMAKVSSPNIGKVVLYVADSALVTSINLELMKKNTLKLLILDFIVVS